MATAEASGSTRRRRGEVPPELACISATPSDGYGGGSWVGLRGLAFISSVQKFGHHGPFAHFLSVLEIAPQKFDEFCPSLGSALGCVDVLLSDWKLRPE